MDMRFSHLKADRFEICDLRFDSSYFFSGKYSFCKTMDRLWDTLQGPRDGASRMAHSQSESATQSATNGGSGSLLGSDLKQKPELATESSYADKFMERIISMAIPTTTTSSKRELDRVLGRIEMQRSRPPLSMQTMSKNSILLMQRLSIPFETIDYIINFINWENPVLTITIMIFISICILKPINLLTVPMFYICFEIILPAYIIQNPNCLNDDNSENGNEINNIDIENELPKPVNEFSREFLLNLTDLQNHMLLYVHVWNFINAWCWKLFYFRDEMLSWFIFIFLLVSGLFIECFGMKIILMFLSYIKLSIVIILWALVISLHPTNRIKILEKFYSEELRLKTMSLINYYESKVIKDLDLTTEKLEIKQIEIFELQFFNNDLKCWQFVCFSNDNYPPNSHIRLNNLPIGGTFSLDSIVPPKGWKFVNNSNGYKNKNKGKNSGTDSNTSFENNSSDPRILIDSEKRKLLKEKKRHQKFLKRQKKQLGKTKAKDFIINKKPESNQLKIRRRRESNDFNNILIDPLILDKHLIEQLETGVTLNGWSLDLCPSSWVTNNHLQGVFDIDDENKWVYDFINNGINAYSEGVGIGINNSVEKLKKSRGDVRRRRWIRYAVKEIVKDSNNNSDANDIITAGGDITDTDTSTSTEDENEDEDDDDVDEVENINDIDMDSYTKE